MRQEKQTATASSSARQRVILLGASNVARGISVITETSRRLHGRPLEIFAAFGRGRSYGRTSRFLGFELPGIAECGLWQSLSDRPPLATSALVTDIGNDLFYDHPLEQIVDWIDACLTRLSSIGAESWSRDCLWTTCRGFPSEDFGCCGKFFFPSVDRVLRRSPSVPRRSIGMWLNWPAPMAPNHFSAARMVWLRRDPHPIARDAARLARDPALLVARPPDAARGASFAAPSALSECGFSRAPAGFWP